MNFPECLMCQFCIEFVKEKVLMQVSADVKIFHRYCMSALRN